MGVDASSAARGQAWPVGAGLLLQVGKKLRKPQNETQLDFKSRSIALPSQNIGQDAERGVVSERKLTLKASPGLPSPPPQGSRPPLAVLPAADSGSHQHACAQSCMAHEAVLLDP